MWELKRKILAYNYPPLKYCKPRKNSLSFTEKTSHHVNAPDNLICILFWCYKENMWMNLLRLSKLQSSSLVLQMLLWHCHGHLVITPHWLFLPNYTQKYSKDLGSSKQKLTKGNKKLFTNRGKHRLVTQFILCNIIFFTDKNLLNHIQSWTVNHDSHLEAISKKEQQNFCYCHCSENNYPDIVNL